MVSDRILRRCAAGLALFALPATAGAADGNLRDKIVAAFAGVTSYRVTVLGSVRSLGVWQKPDRYQMTTEFNGKTVKTIIDGSTLWQYDGGRWEKAGTASSNLDVDIAGLVRTVRHDPKAVFTSLPDQTQDGKRVGTFSYTFADGTEETCNYDRSTYRVTRCKSDELTLLYSSYNDPSIKIAVPK
jgi:outer membrane lipoprotein-sorting protein